MNLKNGLLAALDVEQLKELCAELDLAADRRSRDALIAAVAGAKRAKPELIINKLTVAQLRAVLAQFELPARGSKDELVQRLLSAGGRSLPRSGATTLAAGEHAPGDPVPTSLGAGALAPSTSDLATEYRHSDLAIQRPDAGVQDQFQTKKPPKVYRYDSSLDPALSWDEQRERDLGEWRFARARLRRASRLPAHRKPSGRMAFDRMARR
jgi:adenine-specific DNA-methyltransferase